MTQPTQSKHPWRATARTALAVVLALLSLAVEVVLGLDLDATAIGAQILVVAGTVTRILAIPGVNVWLEQHLPDFAAARPALQMPRPHADSAAPYVDVDAVRATAQEGN